MHSDRAKQFMPFDSLKGFKEEISKRQKVVVKKRDLSEDDLINLNRLINIIQIGMIVTIEYYDGVDYIKLSGVVSKINLELRYICIVKTKIIIDNIIDIKIDGKTIYDE